MRTLGMQIDGCPLERSPLDFRPIGTRKVYHFIRRTSVVQSFTASSGSFTSNSSISSFTQNSAASPLDVLLALAFRLDDLPDYTEFTNMFDQFCILGVKVRVTPRANNNTITVPNFGNGILYAAKDSSDISLPASLQVLREYQTIMEFSTTTLTNRKWNIKHSPRIAVAAYAGAFNGYSAPSLTWIDTQSPSVQHYGIKFGIPAGVSGGTSQVYDMDFTYHIACRMAQ